MVARVMAMVEPSRVVVASRAHGIGARLKYWAAPVLSSTTLTTFGFKKSANAAMGWAMVAITQSPIGKGLGDAVDEGRIDEGLVTLNIDHDGVIRQVEQRTGLRQPVAATGMIGTGCQGLEAGVAARLNHARIVGGNRDLAGPAQRRTLSDSNDHWLPPDVGQRLVWQAHRRHACGNQDNKFRHVSYFRGAPARVPRLHRQRVCELRLPT